MLPQTQSPVLPQPRDKSFGFSTYIFIIVMAWLVIPVVVCEVLKVAISMYDSNDSLLFSQITAISYAPYFIIATVTSISAAVLAKKRTLVSSLYPTVVTSIALSVLYMFIALPILILIGMNR